MRHGLTLQHGWLRRFPQRPGIRTGAGPEPRRRVAPGRNRRYQPVFPPVHELRLAGVRRKVGEAVKGSYFNKQERLIKRIIQLFSMGDLVLHSESFSNHGSEKGTWERFFFQVQDIAKTGFVQKDFDSCSGEYFNKVMHEITHFYDLYYQLVCSIERFKSGVSSGVYYQVNERGSSTFNRSLELEIRNLVKDFL